MSTAVATHPERSTLVSFANDSSRAGLLALTAAVFLAGLTRSVLEGGAWEANATSAQAAMAGLAVVLLGASVIVSLALGSIRRSLALGGGVALAATALAADLEKASGWNGTSSMLLLLLGLAVAASAAIRPLRVVRVALRAAVVSSLVLIAADPDAASSPLATRYYVEELPFRFRGILNHPVALSTVAALLFAVAICVRYRSSLRVLDATAALAAVVLSDTRSGALAIGLAVAGRLVLPRLSPDGSAFRLAVVAVPAGLVAAQVGVTVWATARVDSLREVTTGRSLIWDWCWEAVVRQPGLGGDPALLAGGRYPEVAWWHCHDQALSTGYHLGAVGLAALGILLAGLLADARAWAGNGVLHPWVVLCVVLVLGIFETPLGFQGDLQATFLALAVVLLVAGNPTETPANDAAVPVAPGPLGRREAGCAS